MGTWLLVTGDVGRRGAMDRAHLALAEYLSLRGDEVHVVAHSASEELLALAGTHWHAAPKPAGSVALGSPVLDAVGRYWARRLSARGARVVVNGGNCLWGDVNWVHYVHAAYAPDFEARGWRPFARRLVHEGYLRAERTAFSRARLLIANSHRTAEDLRRLGVPAGRIRVVYCGIEGERFRPPSASEREAVRAGQGWRPEQPVVAFVGALGDRRKGFDTVYKAWAELHRKGTWDGVLVVMGSGAELPAWRERARAGGLSSIQFLGFRTDVARLLAGCDALVAPTRYESYGLGVVEALCTGLPAFVSRGAGVAERYPPSLRPLLLEDPEDARALAEALAGWASRRESVRAELPAVSELLRREDWRYMAERFVSCVESVPLGGVP
ncbi:glycosyltransferase family 4 protein [Archangium violaceum]|uniref:glycosyltransferase family 4 protein n=1 Tax=Archangium violaceum TaxID=83451 RepID=UPI0036DF28DD